MSSSTTEMPKPTPSKETVTASLTQPKMITGTVDDKNVYRNSFYRPGKVLDSNIIIENGGVLRKLSQRAKEFIPSKCHEAKNYIIVDEIVDKLYGDLVLQGLNDGGIETYKVVVPADAVDESGNPSAERFKTLQVFSECADQILQSGITKTSCIISLGGGVVNNLAGFLASSLYRGITLVHITTTMMGMADAAIDFKQAVNHPLGKNLLGAYYPATNIIMDPEVLESLSKRHILNGISEALKHALCQSMKLTHDIVDPLAQDLHKALRDADYLQKVCRECIDYKVPTLIHYNETDFNEMVPQYGHAICHSIETLSFYTPGVSPLLHGEAVSIGMVCTAEVGYIMGYTTAETVQQHYDLLSKAGLPVFVPKGLELERILEKMKYDKHFVKKPTMGLLETIGNMHQKEDGDFAVEIEIEDIAKALQANFERRDAFVGEPRDLYTLDAVAKAAEAAAQTNDEEMESPGIKGRKHWPSSSSLTVSMSESSIATSSSLGDEDDESEEGGLGMDLQKITVEEDSVFEGHPIATTPAQGL